MAAPAVVCVPARNEAQRLPRLIRSLAEQDAVSKEAPLRVVIVANNCMDGTAAAVRAMDGVEHLSLRLIAVSFDGAAAHVGTARRLALDAGADWLESESAADGVLLTTDADARVPPDWVAANLSALAGADIVGGRLVVDPDETQDPALSDLQARIECYWSAVRALEDRLDPPSHDPAPRHGDHTGASLALPVALYRRVGGLPPLRRGEDNALVVRVQEQGGRLRHCPRVSVRVSDRADGRAEGGMASEMVRRAAVANGQAAYRLPTPAHWQAMVARRAALRDAWREAVGDADRLLAFVEALGLSVADLAAVSPETCPNDIAFVERASRCVEVRDGDPPLVELDAALADFADRSSRFTPDDGRERAA